MSLVVDIARLGSPQRTLVKDLHFDVPAANVLTLMGPSGCGKSSLLAAIAGTLDTATASQAPLAFEGRVELDGQNVTRLPTERRGIGLLFQDALLFAHMSVGENLLFAVPAGPRAERQAQVDRVLAEAGLDGYAGRDPATLSGGQRARVAVMRALLARPRALLLDEPFSRLDAALRTQFRRFVFDHIRAAGIPAVLVTHDRDDVAEPERVVELVHAG